MQDAPETSLDGARRDAVSQFRLRTRRIARRYLPPSDRHGALLLRTAAAVDDGSGRPPIDAAVGVELFHVYGLIRAPGSDAPPSPDADAPPETGRTEPRSAVLLAGDRVLAESFDRVAGVDRDPASVRRSVRALARSTRTLCEGGTTAPDGLAAPSEAGALATELGGLLADGSPPPLDDLREAGRALGTAIRRRQRLPGDRDAVEPERDAAEPSDVLAHALADARSALDRLPDRIASDLGAVADALDPDRGTSTGAER